MEDDPQVIEAMVHFMYRFDYDDDPNPASSMKFNTQVYQAGDKYGISMLKACATRKLKEAVQTSWRTKEFPDIIMEAYSETDRDLQKLIAKISTWNIDS